MPIPFTCPHCGLQTNVADEYAGQSGPCSRCGKTITVPFGPPSAPSAARVSRPRGSVPVVLIALAAVGAIVICSGIPIALLLPAVQAAREAARRSQCTNNLKQLALAMHNYHDTYKCFPPAYVADEDGRPMHSWRVLLLPYLEQQPLYEQYNFDEPWDSPANLALADIMPDVFRCPSDPSTPFSNTSYAMIVGPGTLFDGTRPCRIADISDGTSNTIMLVEAAGSGINWMEPTDLDVQKLALGINNPSGQGIRSYHPGGANVAMCDGSVRFISATINPQTLKALITKAGGEPVGDF